jgi:hypothetical protein
MLKHSKSISRAEFLNFDDRARIIQVDRRKGVLMLCLSLTAITIAFQTAALFLPSLITIVVGKGIESPPIPASIGFQSVCINNTCSNTQEYCVQQSNLVKASGTEKDAAQVLRDCATIRIAFFVEIGAAAVNLIVFLGGFLAVIYVTAKTPKL